MKLLILILILSGCISGVKVAAPIVEAGDTVSINYVAKIDGAVFDTEPLNFTVGEGFMIPAIEEAVLGMKVGDEKTVVVPPEKGYGERNESLVRSMSRFVIIPREIEISIERFRLSYNKEPVLNDTVEDIYWTSRVIKVNDTVVVRHEPLPVVKETQKGKIKIDSNDTSVIMEYIPILNITFQTAVGEYATVIDSNETSMTVDYNHPFAGKTLVFSVKVEGIEKAKP
ncbi:MAG: FKBP-type peptidyl-prolyl cis-trans isomerase [Methanobacteriota archaeon]